MSDNGFKIVRGMKEAIAYAKSECVLCKLPRAEHNSITAACPIGRPHRLVGYTQYHYANRFTAAEDIGRAG
jgi:hypothetical protein